MGIAAGGAARAGLRAAEPAYSDGFRRKALAFLFFAALFQVEPVLGGQRVDPYRLFLMATLFPFVGALLTRKGGRVTLSDWLIVGFCGWIMVTLFYHHGTSMMALAIITAIEIFGGYAAGRLLIRNPDDFKRFVRYSLVALLILLPFGLFELVTGRMVLEETIGRFLPVNSKFDSTRFGFYRVQAGFPHAILFGLFCSVNFANVIYIYRERLRGLLPRIALVGLMTMLSLSSAPILSIIIQSGTFIWGIVTRNSWKSLIALIVAILVFLELASNRGALILFIHYMTIDPSSGWYRYFIWVYGIENVKASPIFGIGMNDWARANWMVQSSVDNFWLLMAMRHGFVGFLMLALAFVVHVWRILATKGLSDDAKSLRDGYLIGLLGLCFTLTTVHVWGVVAVFVMFYLGAGSFLYTSRTSLVTDEAIETAPTEPATQRRSGPVFARDFSATGTKPVHKRAGLK